MKRAKLKEKGYKYIYIFEIHPKDSEKESIEIYRKEKMSDEELIKQKEFFELNFFEPKVDEPRIITI